MLSPEDRKELREMLEPQVKAVTEQAKTLSKFGERMSSVETSMKNVENSVKEQTRHCNSVTKDFSILFREQEKEIVKATAIARTADEKAEDLEKEHSRLLGWLWSLLVGLVIMLAGWIYNLFVKK